jgi:site-specific recombinase XerD
LQNCSGNIANHCRENEANLLFSKEGRQADVRRKVALRLRLREMLKELEIEGAALHAFRHLAASEMIENGAALSVLQRQMRQRLAYSFTEVRARHW